MQVTSVFTSNPVFDGARRRRIVRFVTRVRWILLLVGGFLAAKADPPANTPPAGSDDLYSVGKQLFDEYAPPEVKEQYEFPSKTQWDDFAKRLQRALDNDSLEGLAAYEPEARSALAALHSLPEYQPYSDWLEVRLDEIEAASQTAAPPGQRPPGPSISPNPESIPYYDLWLARVKGRPVPAGAGALMPRLRAAFAAEGVPPELAWIAEAESSLNPDALSPAGARGLFQLTPGTAKAIGLRTFLPDERTDPEASARAAAHLLRMLYAKFGSWPLALSAYNAGEGRVSRLLASRGGDSFKSVASALPAETRMYVPKVLALIEVRTGIGPDELSAPSA